MNNCQDYTEQISAYADGELSEKDSKQLLNHITVCPRCARLLDDYRIISRELSLLSTIAPPDALRRNVMTRIAESDMSNSVMKHRRMRTLLMRAVPLAACLAVVVFATFRFANPLKPSSAPMMDSGVSYNARIESTGGGLFEFDLAPEEESSEREERAVVESKLESSEDSVVSDVSEKVNAEPVVPPPSISPQIMQSHAPEPEAGESTLSGSLQNRSDSFFCVITVTGELPDILSEFEITDSGDGIWHIQIPRETAIKLIDLGFDTTYHNETASIALVEYLP